MSERPARRKRRRTRTAKREEPPDVPRSGRWPWLRAVFAGGVTPLLPLVWVVETRSCSEDEPRELTGLDVASQLGTNDPELLLVLALLGLAIAAPWIAAKARDPLRRLAVHAAALPAALAAVATLVFAMFFTLFTQRSVRPAGLLVLGLGAGFAIDAVTRLVLSVREWLAWRRPPERAADEAPDD